MDKAISARITYLGNCRFETTHLRSAQKICTDVSESHCGMGHYPSPVDVMATALATCAMSAMAIGVEKNGCSFQGCHASVDAVTVAADRAVVTAIDITFYLRADYDAHMRKRIERYAYKGCYVGNTLSCQKNFTFVYE